MKYAKELVQSLDKLPLSLRDVSICYKTWKKLCKQLTCAEGMHKLTRECDMVDRIFMRLYHASLKKNANKNYETSTEVPYSNPWGALRHFTCTEKTPFNISECTPEIALNFARINARTVYKVCKRIQKKTSPTQSSEACEPMSWLTTMRASLKYDFLGGRKITHLENMVKSDTEECPICLETIQKRHMLILKCGHYSCLECMLQHTGMDKRVGIWFNLLANAQRNDCPICRHTMYLGYGASILI